MPSGFSAFMDAVKSPALKAVAAHWGEARGGNLMPSWSDLNPAKIAPHLRIVWSYRFDSGSDQFFGRLVGERLNKIIDGKFSGVALSALHPPDTAKWVDTLCRRAITTPALYAYSGEILVHQDLRLPGERIVMPLAANKHSADGVLGATDCVVPLGERASLVAPQEAAETWISLK